MNRWPWLLLLFSVFFSGCNRGPSPVSVSGTVTWQGKPIDHGSINLFALASDGITVGSEIKEGKFSIDKVNGPTPGKYRVEVLAFRDTKKTEFDVDLNQQVAIEEQILPKEYNQASTLEAEIVAGKANELKFDLPLSK